VEQYESEMEELQANQKKKSKPSPKMAQLEETVGLHKEHMEKLDKILRALDNDMVAAEEVVDLQEDMEYYMVGGGRGDGWVG
jgi:CCR4-NOT transcription complex subunit 3